MRNKNSTKKFFKRAFSFFREDRFSFELTYPKILLHQKTEEDGIECGPFLSNLDTGIYFCKYDYGTIIRIAILGLGFKVWWM